MSDIFIIAAKRSAIGSFGGSLKNTTPIDLAIPVAKAAIEQSGIQATIINHAVYGHVIQTEAKVDVAINPGAVQVTGTGFAGPVPVVIQGTNTLFVTGGGGVR